MLFYKEVIIYHTNDVMHNLMDENRINRLNYVRILFISGSLEKYSNFLLLLFLIKYYDCIYDNMTKMDYIPRIADEVLERMLHTTGAVHITGPKGCGKSTTGARKCNTEYRLQDPENTSLRMLAATKPSELFKNKTPILLDEWGEVPSLWDAVRNEVDLSNQMSEFILTGSSVPKEDGYSHSGVDRIAPMRMRTMSLFESGDSNGCVSLKSLFDGNLDISGASPHTLDDIAFLTIRGGWPRSVRIDKEYAQDVVMNYYNATIGIDVFRVDGKKKNLEAIDRLMRSYARNTSTMASMKSIIDDVISSDRLVTQSTVEQYIDSLNRLFIIEDVPAWSPNVKSKTAIRTTPKRHLADPSLAAASLNMDSKRLISDMRTFGFFFESLCVRDLRVYSELLRGKVKHYHDSKDLEVDIIVELRDGRWGEIEVKMGAGDVPEAESNLIKLRDQIVNDGGESPSFMMVLISTGYVSVTEKGVLVVPIGCLGP